jgi:hypothetical protein
MVGLLLSSPNIALLSHQHTDIMNTLALEHFEMEVCLNGKWVALEDTYGYGSTMDMLTSIRTVLSVFGAEDSPAVLTVNGEHTLRTTASKADEAVNNWCSDN